MRMHLIAATLIVAFATPVLASEGFYVVFDSTMKKCTTMSTKPTDMKRYKMMGTYPTPGEAEAAMLTMTECK